MSQVHQALGRLSRAVIRTPDGRAHRYPREELIRTLQSYGSTPLIARMTADAMTRVAASIRERAQA